MKWLLYFLIPLALSAVPMPKDRPVHLPFITGDAFRSLCDFAYDELSTDLKPAEVQKGAVIFVKTDYLGAFFEKVHPHIVQPYVIVSHNSDDAAPGVYAKYLEDPKILAWFAQNYDGTAHVKMHPIPIGLANGHWAHGNVKTLEKVANLGLAKKHLVYMNIAVQTFPKERQVVWNHFANSRFCLREEQVAHEPFLKSVASASFVVAPRGNGLDTHRLWEALYLNSVPIVKSSSIDGLYEGLPVLVVRDWKEVSEDFLKQAKFGEPQKERLSIHYWMQQIRSCASSGE